MHIGIDARFYGPFGKGLGRYVQKLIEHLENTESEHRFTVFVRKENWDAYQPQSPRFTKVLADFPWYSLREQLGFPRLLNRLSVDLMHFPHYNVPVLYRRPFVVTIHDLIVSRYPTKRATTLNPLLYKIKHLAYQLVIRSAIRRAQSILTVSEYSKRVIQASYRVPETKIIVTYEAADAMNAGAVKPELRARWKARGPYLLYVGNAYPHKNLEGLLAAFRILHEAEPAYRLVLVGKMEYFYERIVALARELQLGDAVVFPGYVTDEELAALYSFATLYVFPSFEEGFGLPPLEAMAAGVPVVSSNASCLPEILGDAARFVDPHSPEAMAAGMLEVLRSPQQQQALRTLGAERVRKFRWDDLARRTLDVYTTKRSSSSHEKRA